MDAAVTAKQVTANLQEQVCALEEQKVIMFAYCMFSLYTNVHVHHDVWGDVKCLRYQQHL